MSNLFRVGDYVAIVSPDTYTKSNVRSGAVGQVRTTLDSSSGFIHVDVSGKFNVNGSGKDRDLPMEPKEIELITKEKYDEIVASYVPPVDTPFATSPRPELTPAVKRGRGRPRKVVTVVTPPDVEIPSPVLVMTCVPLSGDYSCGFNVEAGTREEIFTKALQLLGWKLEAPF